MKVVCQYCQAFNELFSVSLLPFMKKRRLHLFTREQKWGGSHLFFSDGGGKLPKAPKDCRNKNPQTWLAPWWQVAFRPEKCHLCCLLVPHLLTHPSLAVLCLRGGYFLSVCGWQGVSGGIVVDRFALSSITVQELRSDPPVRFIPECRSKIETFTQVMHHFVY